MPVRSLTVQGMLAAMAVAAHLAAVVWPGPGQFVAGFACLPVALAALADRRRAPLGALAALLLTAMFNVKQGAVFGLLNAPLGLVAGTMLAAGRPRWAAVAATAAAAALGLLLLSFGAGFPALGGGLHERGNALAGTAYIGFGLAYGWAWVDFLRNLHKRLGPVLDRYRG